MLNVARQSERPPLSQDFLILINILLTLFVLHEGQGFGECEDTHL